MYSGPYWLARRHFFRVRLDLSGAHLALDLGFAAGSRHQLGAAEIDVGRAGAMVVIDRFGCPRDYGDAEDRHGLASIHWTLVGCPLCWIRNLRAHTTDGQKHQCRHFHTLISSERETCKWRADVRAPRIHDLSGSIACTNCATADAG